MALELYVQTLTRTGRRVGMTRVVDVLDYCPPDHRGPRALVLLEGGLVDVVHVAFLEAIAPADADRAVLRSDALGDLFAAVDDVLDELADGRARPRRRRHLLLRLEHAARSAREQVHTLDRLEAL